MIDLSAQPWWIVVPIALAAVLVAMFGGWPVTTLVLRAAKVRDAAPPGPGHVLPPVEREVLRGGRWIGLLERALMAGGIATGFPTVVAVVIAVKALGRYPEIRDNPAVAERFIVGTLASMAFACACGVAAYLVIISL